MGDILSPSYLLGNNMRTLSDKRKQEVAQSYAITANQSETARQLGINKSTVHRIIERDDVREMIDEEREKFLESLPNARANIQYLIDNFRTVDASNAPILSAGEKDQAWKSSMEVLRAAGMLPSHYGSIHIENVYQETRVQIISPVIQLLLNEQQNALTCINEENDDGGSRETQVEEEIKDKKEKVNE